MLDASWSACYPSPVANGVRHESISEREIMSGRALAAVAYLPGLCFVGLLEAPRNRFVRFHARQGLALFLCEIVAWLAIAIVDDSLGRIPVLGVIAGASLRLTLGLGFLAATAYGVAKGMSGETVRIPFLGDLPDKLRF